MGTPSRIILNDLGVGKHISERKRRGGEEGGERERIGEGERGGGGRDEKALASMSEAGPDHCSSTLKQFINNL